MCRLTDYYPSCVVGLKGLVAVSNGLSEVSMHEVAFSVVANEVERWYQQYRRDFERVIDEWYEAYRRDFVPDRSGRVHLGVPQPVTKRVETRIKNFVVAGSGEVTRDTCGGFLSHYGCLQHWKHHGKGVYAMKLYSSCDRPLCSACSKFGWAPKEANLIVDRFLACEEKNFGQIEHLVCSAPLEAYDLTLKEFNAKARETLFSLDVLGGVMIFHGIRHQDKPNNPHAHVLGWIKGGYARCRFCSHKNNCSADCEGFDNRRWQLFLKTGWYVKVMLEERKSIGATAWYQLNHCSVDPFKRRFRATSWFGVAGYNNLGVKRVKHARVNPRSLCPECSGQMGFLKHVGSKELVLNPESRDFKRVSWEEYLEDGKPAWEVREFKPRRGDVHE